MFKNIAKDKYVSINGETVKTENAALHYLWARHRLQSLGDYITLDNRVDDPR